MSECGIGAGVKPAGTDSAFACFIRYFETSSIRGGSGIHRYCLGHSLRRFEFLHRFRQGRHNGEQIADDAVICDVKYGSFRILVNGNDIL